MSIDHCPARCLAAPSVLHIELSFLKQYLRPIDIVPTSVANMVVSKGITEGDMFNKMLQGFHQELQAERAAAAPPSNSTGESQTEAEGSISVEEVAAAENRRFVKCHLKDCRRRSPTDCIHA